MKIELELNDTIVEGLLKAKKKAPASVTIEQVAKTLLEVGLVRGGFLEIEDVVQQAFKNAMSKAGLGDLEKMFEGVGDSKVGMVGIKIGTDGKAEMITNGEAPEGLRGFMEELQEMISDNTTDGVTGECTCPNCVARRATETKKYS